MHAGSHSNLVTTFEGSEVSTDRLIDTLTDIQTITQSSVLMLDPISVVSLEEECFISKAYLSLVKADHPAYKRCPGQMDHRWVLQSPVGVRTRMA